METKIVKSLCAMVLGLTAVTAQAIPLSDLFAGQTIESGDKSFSGWELIAYVEPDGGNAIDLSMVEVTALPAEGGSSNPGLRFDFAQPLAVSDFADETSLWFSYAVDVLDPGQQIVGSTLELTGFRAENDGGFADGYVEITGHEGGFDLFDPDLEVYSDIIGPFVDEQLADADAFGPTSSTVFDTLLIAVSFEGIFEISSFEQRFNQQASDPGVPTPATLALLLLGLAGISLNRRRPAAGS